MPIIFLCFPLLWGLLSYLLQSEKKKSWFIFPDQTQKHSQFNTIHIWGGHIFSNIKWPFSVEFRRISDISGTRNRISGYTCEVKWKLYSLTWLFSSFFQSNFWHIWRFFKNFALPLQYAKYFGKNSTTNSCLYSFLQGKHIQNPKIKFWVTPRSHTKKRIATDFGFV